MLAIAGGKGGCGKTTTTLGLAAALARRGADPLVADADRNGPDCHLLAGTAAGHEPDGPRHTESDDSGSAEPVAVDAKGFPGVEVVTTPPATISDGRFQAALDRLTARERLLERARPVLVDCPAGAGRDAIAPLRASDAALLTTTIHPASLRDAAKTAAIADRLGADIVGTVLTRVPSWATTHGREGRITGSADGSMRPGVVRRVERLLDAPVVGTVPAVDCSGRAVLDHSGVRASYARLARTLDGGEHLTGFTPKAP